MNLSPEIMIMLVNAATLLGGLLRIERRLTRLETLAGLKEEVK